MKLKLTLLLVFIMIMSTILITAAMWGIRSVSSPLFPGRRGETTESTADYPEDTSLDIGEERIIEIVLARIPGADSEDIVRLDYDYTGDRITYDGKVVKNRIIYEFTIDGSDGTILRWEVDG